MTITFEDLQRDLSRRCDDMVTGIATGGSATTLADSRLAGTYSTDDEFNGGLIVINEGGGNMLWVTDCEAVLPGDFTSVTITDTACIAWRAAVYKYNGKWSYGVKSGSDASDQAYADKTLASTYSTIFGQVMLYFTAVPVGPYDVLTLAQAGGTAILAVRITSAGALAVYNTPADTTYTLDTSTTVTAGTWHRLELGTIINASTGQVDLWWDQSQVLSRRAQNTGSTSVGRLMLGVKNTSDASSRALYFDNVSVDQEYIGTREGETEKTITDYTGSSGTFTWSGNIVAPTAHSTRYAVYDWAKTKWAKEQKKQAINDAIATLWPTFFKRVVDPALDSGDATITIADNTFQYALPTACETVLNVWLEPSTTSSPYHRITNVSQDNYSGARYLRLPDAKSYTTGRKVRIEYIARPETMVNDNDELGVDTAYEGAAKQYILNYALGILWESTSALGDDNLPMSQKFYRQAEEVRRRHKMRFPQSHVSLEVDVAGRKFVDRIAPFM